MTATVGGAVIAAIIAFLTGLLALMSQEGVNQLSDISQLSLMVLLVGGALTFFKDFNALWTRRMLSGEDRSKTSSPVPVGIIALLLACSLMSACSGTRAAYSAAEGVEDTAKVIGEHYYALVREANNMAEAGELTGSNLQSAQRVVRDTRPSVLALAEAAQKYGAIRSAQNEAELERAINDAALAVSRLVDVIRAWRSTTSIEHIDRDLQRIIEERPVYLVAA